MNKLFIFLMFISFSAVLLQAQYKDPPKEILDILDKRLPPAVDFLSFDTISVEFGYDPLPPLSRIAEPYLGLAGIRFSSRLNGALRRRTYNLFAVVDYESNKRYIPGIDLEEGFRTYRFSPDNTKCALSVETEKGIVLYVIDIRKESHFQVPGLYINDAFGNDGFNWIDNHNLMIATVPDNRGKAPEAPKIPSSPITDESYGETGLIVTYQNLLSNSHDISLFGFYFQAQAVLYNTESRNIRKIGKPGIYSSISVSPDSKYLLVTRIEKPYSYIFPYYYFPKSYEVWDADGKLVFTVHKQPLMDNLPQGGVPEGPRHISWQPHHDAMLYWAEALDGGNPENKADYRDRIIRLNAPFDQSPQEIAKTVHRFSGIEWSEQKDICIIKEFDRDRVWTVSTLYDIGRNSSRILFDMSVFDRYNHPGELISIKTPRNENVFVHRNDALYFNNSRGATPEGNLPYIARYNISKGEMDILYRSKKDSFQLVLGFYGKDFSRIFISSEKPDIPTNYFIVDLGKDRARQVTFHENPYPQITNLKKELVSYERKDGVNLSGTLYYPLDYKDGERVPLIINAYPREYTDSSVAEQVSASPNRFIYFWGASTLYMTLHGYAVLDGAAIPIVGDPDTVNDTFIEQTVASVEAAVNYLDSKGIIDPDRVGITGHSYGAFMVATVLGNSDICSAGVARSGAYNRTLTPFGFQGERRSLWEALDFYVKISPFMYADSIKKPILFIHGEKDSNPGTHLVQTERMFQAVKGTGGIARMVILPYEEHGYYAKESVKHVLAEMVEWFDKYLKQSENG